MVFVPKKQGPLIDELNQSEIQWQSLELPNIFLLTSRKKYFQVLLASPFLFLYCLYFLYKMKGLIKTWKIERVHSTGLKMQILTGVFGKLSRLKTLLHIRDCIESSLIRKLFTWIDQSPHVHFLANSQLTADSLLPIKALVIYNGFYPPQSKKKLSLKESLHITEETFLVGIVGVIARWKGQREFIEMAAILLKKFPDMHFVIIGSEIYDTTGEKGQLKELELRAEKIRPSGHIHFLPFQSHMDSIYPELSALVHASIDPEPFGRVIVEAMFHEIPLTASAAGGPTEIIQDSVNGLLHTPGDINQMAANIEKIYLNPALGQDLGSKGKLRAEQFSMNLHCTKMRQQLDLD